MYFTLNALALSLFMLCFGAMVSAQTATFQLSGVQFPPSAYLQEIELQEAVAPYLDRPVAFEDRDAMVAAVQRLYLARGVVTARALIEPQEVTNGGTLRLTLIEAAVEDVEVVDGITTDPQFLRGGAAALSYEQPFWIGRDRYWIARKGMSYEGSRSNLTGVGLTQTQLNELDASLASRLQKPVFVWAASLGLKPGTATSDRIGDTGATLRLQASCPAPCFEGNPRGFNLAPFAFMGLG